MKNRLIAALIIFCSVCVSCNMTTPEKYFDETVLNTNKIVGFADDGLQRQLDYPSAKMVGNDPNKSEPMKRKEIIDDAIAFVEEDLRRINALSETADTKEMIEESRALHEYILPVYKNEYTKLAEQYDQNASPEVIKASLQSIHDKYYPGFDKLYNRLIATGKVYAAKHKINVHWAM